MREWEKRTIREMFEEGIQKLLDAGANVVVERDLDRNFLIKCYGSKAIEEKIKKIATIYGFDFVQAKESAEVVCWTFKLQISKIFEEEIGWRIII